MQAHTSKTGCRGCHCDLHQHMLCLNYVFVYGFSQVLIRSARHFYFVGALLFCDNLHTHLGALLLGRLLLIGRLQYLFLAATKQLLRTHFRPSVNIWLSNGVTTCRFNFNFTDIIHLMRPIHDAGNGTCSSLNMCILTQLALRRWPNVGPTSTLTLGQRRLTNVGPTWFVNWPNVGPTVARQRWPNVVPTSAQRWRTNVGPTLAQRYANGCMPTLYQHWPNGGCVTGFLLGEPIDHRWIPLTKDQERWR